jgi:hypothetical protein
MKKGSIQAFESCIVHPSVGRIIALDSIFVSTHALLVSMYMCKPIVTRKPCLSIIDKSPNRVGFDICFNTRATRFDVHVQTYTHPKTVFSNPTLSVVEGAGALRKCFPSTEMFSTD